MTEQHSDIKVIDEFGREAGHIPARHRAIYLLPNAFTTAALFAGFFAIVKAMNHEFNVAAVSIFCAMVLDGMDGRVARLTKTQKCIWRAVRQFGRYGFIWRRPCLGRI